MLHVVYSVSKVLHQSGGLLWIPPHYLSVPKMGWLVRCNIWISAGFTECVHVHVGDCVSVSVGVRNTVGDSVSMDVWLSVWAQVSEGVLL